MPALFASLVLLMATARKKGKKAQNVALVAGTGQTLSNLFFSFDIYSSVSGRHKNFDN